MKKNARPDYSKLLEPIDIVTTSTETLLDGVFGSLMGDQREDLKRIHSSAWGLHTLFLEVITSIGIENIARWAYLKDKFSTVIDPIIENCSMLLNELDGPLTSEQAFKVNRIRDIGTNLRDLVDRLWLYSSIANNQIEANLEKVDLARIIDDLNPAKRFQTMTMSVSLPQRLPLLYADAEALYTVLYELIQNAVVYSNYGVVRVLVQATSSHVVIRVKDDGGGISKERERDIFEPFYHGNIEQSGIGLGLSIAHGLTELQHGRVWLQHSSDTGSIFALQIPTANARH